MHASAESDNYGYSKQADYRGLLDALRNQRQNLIERIARLIELMKSLSEGETRDRLLDEISALDVIAEVMRKALEGSIIR